MSEIHQNPANQSELETQFYFLDYSFHELRNPLTVVYSCAQLAVDRLPDGPQFDRLRRIMGQMLNQSEETVEMLEEFLEASRMQAGKLQLDLSEVELREFCQQTLMHLTEPQQERIELILPATEKKLTLQADGLRLENTLSILLLFGLTHTAEPARIKLVLDEVGSNSDFQIKLVIPNLEISEIERTEIFDLYYPQNHKNSVLKAGKSGVGLFVARGVVMAHNGTLQYDQTLPGFQIILKAD